MMREMGRWEDDECIGVYAFYPRWEEADMGLTSSGVHRPCLARIQASIHLSFPPEYFLTVIYADLIVPVDRLVVSSDSGLEADQRGALAL